MKQVILRQTGLARLLCLLCCMLVTVASHAAIDILDGIDITRGQGQSTIHIRLSIPLSYKSHVPQRSGDLLRIFVEPLPSLGSTENALLGLQTLQWSPDKQVPLFDVTYEGEGFANSSITLRFQEDVEFEVPNTGGIRSIDVVIKHPETSQMEIQDKRVEPGLGMPSESALGVMPDAGAENRNVASQVTPTTSIAGQTVTDTVVPAAAAVSPFPYVINLTSSVTPLLAKELPDLEEFVTYRLYTTTLDKDGKKLHRLRLGFF